MLFCFSEVVTLTFTHDFLESNDVSTIKALNEGIQGSIKNVFLTRKFGKIGRFQYGRHF